MANGNVSLPANTWVKIADSGITALSFQNKGGRQVYIAATSADSAPSGDYKDWPRYARLQGEAGINASTLFSGVSGAAYVWAYSPGQDGLIWRSHA